MNWKDINCRECRHCNRKGKPSVMKGSAYCQEYRGMIPAKEVRFKHRSNNFLSFFTGIIAKMKKGGRL